MGSVADEKVIVPKFPVPPICIGEAVVVIIDPEPVTVPFNLNAQRLGAASKFIPFKFKIPFTLNIPVVGCFLFEVPETVKF